MLAILSKLEDEFAAEVIEDCLIDRFLTSNKIKIKLNNLLVASQKRGQKNVACAELTRNLLPSLSLSELAILFELLIPSADRKLNGAFFTPESISQFIAEKGIRSKDDKVCDPSCGCGAILLAAGEYIRATFSQSLRETIENNIYGVDICDYNIRRCDLLLNLHLVVREGDQKRVRVNLRVANSLDADWSKLFPSVFRDNKGFDAVVGNPPYVRFQQLDERVRVDLQKFKTIEQGNYNLYVPFYEKGREILSPTGRLVFITPNSFFTIKAGRALRAFIAGNHFIDEIYDFGGEKVFSVSCYTCIVVASRDESNQEILYTKVKGDLLSKQKMSPVAYADLREQKWDMLTTKEKKTINIIENSHHVSLGQLVNIHGGIATLRDKLFFVDRRRYSIENEGQSFPIEKGITRPLVRISDFACQQDLDNNQRAIIFPYNVRGNQVEIIEEGEIQKKYPKAYAYLESIKPQLAERDKGKKDYPAWFAYGRSQGLLPDKESLYTPLYAKEPRFLVGKGELITNGLSLSLREDAEQIYGDEIDLLLLQALLNKSPVLQFYMGALAQTISGGYNHYQTDLLKRFPIVRLGKKQRDELLTSKDPQKLIERLYSL